MMNWKFYFGELWYKILYMICTIIYLINLNKLNNVLLSLDGKGYFELATYDNCAALKYFVVALVLLLVGVGILYIEFKKFKAGYDSVQEFVVIVVSSLMVVVLLILIIKFIAIPIFQIILCCVATIVMAIIAVAS